MTIANRNMPTRKPRCLRAGRFPFWLCGVLLGVGIAPEVVAQQGFQAWVGLYAPERLGWLENENRISELCANPTDLSACYSEMLGPAVNVYALHASPDPASARVGELIVIAVPGRGLSAHYQSSGTREVIDFVPDLYLQDFGYGPYFHQTFASRQEDWFQLPPGPWATAVWLHRPGEQARPTVISVQAGDIIELGGNGMYVVGAEPDALNLRPEQPADLWCQEGDPPPLVAVEPVRFSRDELVDGNGHLLIRPRYLKGC